MKKHVLLASVLLAGAAQAQTGQRTPDKNSTLINYNQIMKNKFFIKEKDYTPVKNISNTTRPLAKTRNNHIQQIASISATRFSGSMNAYGVLTSQQKPLQYNSDLDIVTFAHRKSPGFITAPTSGSGSIAFSWSLNRGTSWDSTCVWADGTNLGRYPQGTIYNPPGNTNINNTYFVATGPTTNGSNWTGNFYASKAYTASVGGNATAPNAPNTQFIPTVFQNSNQVFVRNFITNTSDGLVRAAGTIMDDYVNLNNPRGMAIMRGVFSAGSFTWNLDSLIYPVETQSDGTPYLGFTPYMAWSNDGSIGYAVMLGVRQGATGSMRGFQPIVYKTTNYGATWTLIPPFDFTTLYNVSSRLAFNVKGNNYAVPFFIDNEGMDVTVDVNGNLHLVGLVTCASSVNQDSMFYVPSYNSGGGCGSQNYTFYYGNTHFMPTIMDFVLYNNNTWNGILVDSIGTEGTSGGNNTCSQWNTAGLDVNARIQVSKNDVGDKIFYSWTETDTTVTGHHFNVYPDLYMLGYDVNTNTTTQKTMIIGTSASTPTVAQSGIFWHYMSNKAINVGSGTYEVPFTFSGDPTFSGTGPVDHYYIKGAQFTMSDFSTPATPLSASSLKNNSNIASSNVNVNVYPNPTKDNTQLSVTLKNKSNITIEILNTLGQVINTMTINAEAGQHIFNIDLSNENAGIYFYNVTTNAGKFNGKIIKQ